MESESRQKQLAPLALEILAEEHSEGNHYVSGSEIAEQMREVLGEDYQKGDATSALMYLDDMGWAMSLVYQWPGAAPDDPLRFNPEAPIHVRDKTLAATQWRLTPEELRDAIHGMRKSRISSKNM